MSDEEHELLFERCFSDCDYLKEITIRNLPRLLALEAGEDQLRKMEYKDLKMFCESLKKEFRHFFYIDEEMQRLNTEIINKGVKQ